LLDVVLGLERVALAFRTKPVSFTSKVVTADGHEGSDGQLKKLIKL